MKYAHEVKKSYSNKRVLVTGGAGFIGSHLVHALLALNAQVTVLDNLSTGKLTNIKEMLSSVQFIYGDIRNPKTALQATQGCSFVFHLAACTSVPLSMKNPAYCFEVNSIGTQNMLNAAVQNKVSRFIFASSSAVYGPQVKIHKEDDKLAPCSPYAQSKMEGELLCAQYGLQYALITTCLRYFNVYGERQNPHGHYAAVVARFKELLLAKKPITIFGDGLQTRDFISVEEVTQANLLLGAKNNHTGECFNVATGKSITLLELIKKLEKETSCKSVEILFEPAREGDILYSQACCEKYKNALK